MEYVENNDLLCEYQGFQKKSRCEDHIFSLKGIRLIQKTKTHKPYLAFLDVSKDFDTVNINILFLHLWDSGIQGTWSKCYMLELTAW